MMTSRRIAVQAKIHPKVKIHETSYIDDNVEIEAGTTIWHFCHIMIGSRIGSRCRIGQNVVIGPRASVGNNVKIQNNVSVYEGVTLEDDVFCGPSMVFTNVATPRSAFPRNRPEDNLPTLVKRGASIGANATIRCGCTIGEYALIGAGAVVTQDVPPHAVVYGNPARRKAWACVCGIVLKKMTQGEASCHSCGRSYHLSSEHCTPLADGGTTTLQESSTALSFIPVCDVKVSNDRVASKINQALHKVVKAGQYILGPQVKAFEKEIGSYCGCDYAVGVGSGTDALHLVLRALRVGPGDEVITTPFTFIATTEAILAVGARPVFVDIDPNTLNIDQTQIEAAITPCTKVILPVHLYGRPCNMDAIISTASRYGVKVVEDCAQALGATYGGRAVGTLGDAGCLSFFPSKNLGCAGDGGMVITSDPVIYERVEMLRRHGGRVKYQHEELGINSRLDELQAAILRTKLPFLASWNEERQRIASAYSKTLQPFDQIDRPVLPDAETNHVFNQYTIGIADRENAVEVLRSLGIGTAVYYPTPLHLQPVHGDLGYRRGDLPVSEAAAARVLSLPIYPGLPPDSLERVKCGLQRVVEASFRKFRCDVA